MKIKLSIILLVLVPLCLSAQERNFQIWNLNYVSAKLTGKTSIGVMEKIHYAPRTGSIDVKLGDISIKRDINSWFEAGIAGRILYLRSGNGWVKEQRPMIFGNISAHWNKLEFDFSNRMEYRFCEVGADHFRHRQMLTVEMLPFHFPWFRVYVAEEGFVRFDPQNLHLARLYTGTKIQYSKTLEMKLYYVLEKKKSLPSWSSSDVLGLNMNVFF